MRRNRFRLVWLAVAMVAGVVCVVAGGKETPGKARSKARYYYIEGARAVAEGKNAEAYEYFRKSWLSDPTYPEAASAYGTQRMGIADDSLQTTGELLRSFDLMRGFIDRYPEDFFESQYYGYVASQLDELQESARVFGRLDSLYPQKSSTLVHLSQTYMAMDSVRKAVEALDRYESIEGRSPQVSLQKMSYLLHAGDTVACIHEADALIASNVTEPAYLVLKGNLMSVLQMPDSALICYEAAEKLSPDNGPAKMALASYFKEQGDSVRYDAKMYEALLSEDFGVEEKTDLLAEYLQTLLDDKSDTSRGDHLFAVLRDQYPHEAGLLDLASRYSAAKRDYADAIEQIGYAIDLSPETSDYWGRMMGYQMLDDRYADAVATYDRAVNHLTPDDNLTLMMASAANMAGDYPRAEAAYTGMITEMMPGLNPLDSITDTSLLRPLRYEDLVKMSTLFEMMGDNYYKARDLEKAFRAYDNALFFFGDNALALNNYAYFLAEEGGDLDRAEQMSAKALSFFPDNETYLDTYAWILFRLGRYDDARTFQATAIEKAREADDLSAELFSHYGDILFKAGEVDEAVSNWEQALELEPDNELLKRKVKERTYFEK